MPITDTMAALTAEFQGSFHYRIDADGIFPYPAVLIQADGQRVEQAVSIGDARAAISTVLKNARQGPAWTDLLCGIDMNCKDGQGTTLDSAFILMYVRPYQEPEVGVIEYSWNGGQAIVKDCDWSNPFWPGAMDQAGFLAAARALANRPSMIIAST